MLYTIAIVLLIMWLLGLVTSYTVGGFIHILLVVAIVMVLINVIGGRRTLRRVRRYIGTIESCGEAVHPPPAETGDVNPDQDRGNRMVTPTD